VYVADASASLKVIVKTAAACELEKTLETKEIRQKTKKKRERLEYYYKRNASLFLA